MYRLSELVRHFGGELKGEDIEISAIAPTNIAKQGEITFLSDLKYKKDLHKISASALILKKSDSDGITIPMILTDNPYLYFAKVSNLINPRRKLPKGISPNASIADTSLIGKGCAIGHNCVIEDNSTIGNNTQIFPNVYIGVDVHIGKDVIIYPNVTICDNVKIGNNCIIKASSTIGSDGFGNAKDENNKYYSIPHIGGVLIGDDVRIGSNTTIDAGTFEPTVIGNGVRIDNLVQIAHNVRVGDYTAIASLVGIAGNVTVGKFCMIGGKAGVGDHIQISDYTVIGGYTAVAKNILKPGAYFSTPPIMERKEWSRNYSKIRKLEEMANKIKALELEIESIKNKDS